MLLSRLPHELILNVYRLLYDADIEQLKTDTAQRRLWCLQLLSTSMVCRSWYAAGSEFLSMRSHTRSFLSLDSLLTCVECPTLSTSASASPLAQQHKELEWLELFLESKRNNLQFHRQVRRLVVDLSSTLNSSKLGIRGQQWKNQHTLKRPTCEIEDLSRIIKGLLDTCPNLATLEIVYDPRYTANQRSAQMLAILSKALSDALTMHNAADHSYQYLPTTNVVQTAISSAKRFSLPHLMLTAREPLERCPCCTGRGWDHMLIPLFQHLPTTTLELDHVIPSQSVLEALSTSSTTIGTLVLRGDMLTQTSRFTRYNSSVSSPSRIPSELLSQLHTLEIYLHSHTEEDYQQQSRKQQQPDGDDHGDDIELRLQITFRQIHDIVQPIKSLKRLILHGSKRQSVPLSNSTPPDDDDFTLDIGPGESTLKKDIWDKMQLLAERQQLNCLILENIPGFRCPATQSRLRNVFEDAVVYIT